MQKSVQNVESSLRLNGAAHAIMGGIYRCKIVEPTAATIRAAVCGRADAAGRDETKRMVVRTVQLLGMLPGDSKDDDRADAIAGWLWAAAVYLRELRLA